MSDRLTELQRQRALAMERLAAIERDIAIELGGAPRPAPAPAPTPAVPPIPPSARPLENRPAPVSAEDADAIIARFQREARPVQTNVKLGCFLYFFAALALLVGGLALFYFLHQHR
jgi:hypothetical protein